MHFDKWPQAVIHTQLEAFLFDMLKRTKASNNSIDVTSQMATVEQKIPDWVHEALLDME